MLRDVKRMTSRQIATGSDRCIASNKYTCMGQANSQSHAANKTSVESALCAQEDYKSLSRGLVA